MDGVWVGHGDGRDCVCRRAGPGVAVESPPGGYAGRAHRRRHAVSRCTETDCHGRADDHCPAGANARGADPGADMLFVVALPLVSNQTVRTGAQAPTRATTVPKDSAAVQPQPTAIAVAVTTLNLSFSVKSVVCASEPSRQIIKLVVTAQGGVSPYDYYNATTSLGRAVAGGAPLEVSWRPLVNQCPSILPWWTKLVSALVRNSSAIRN